MNLRFLVCFAIFIAMAVSENILIILDNAQLRQTHSKIISLLQSTHSVEIAYSFGKTKIELKAYDRFKYDHVIVMCLSGKCNNMLTQSL